jgi:hypothetical protein
MPRTKYFGNCRVRGIHFLITVILDITDGRFNGEGTLTSNKTEFTFRIEHGLIPPESVNLDLLPNPDFSVGDTYTTEGEISETQEDEVFRYFQGNIEIVDRTAIMDLPRVRTIVFDNFIKIDGEFVD